ncbi:MAG: DUF6788 family protein [bacterium]
MLQRQVERIKQELLKLGDLRPGSLSEQFNVCGTPGCKCKRSPPQKHGPYYQVSYTRKGKSGTKFVSRGQVAMVKRQLRNYARMRQMADRWIEAATELSELRLEDKKA